MASATNAGKSHSQSRVLWSYFIYRNCTDYDLCEACEAKTTHDPSHVFIQIRTPLPDVYADLHTPLLSSPVYQVSPPIRPISVQRTACIPRRVSRGLSSQFEHWLTFDFKPPSPPRLGCAPPPQLLIPTRPPSPPRLGCAPPPQIVQITVTHNCNTYPDIVLSRHESPNKVLERVQALSPQLKNVTLSTLSRSVTQGKNFIFFYLSLFVFCLK